MRKVAVLGAGPAGTSTAIALRRAGCEVVLVDPAGVAAGESAPPAITAALAGVGLGTAELDVEHSRSLGTASAWGAPGLAYRDYLLDGLGPGWHLDRARFDRMLRDAAVAAGAVLVPERPSVIRRTPSGWSITCRATELTADVVVDATGRRAAFATAQGARRWFADRLVGVTAIVPEPAVRSPATGR